jgi:hypothetical protein
MPFAVFVFLDQAFERPEVYSSSVTLGKGLCPLSLSFLIYKIKH